MSSTTVVTQANKPVHLSNFSLSLKPTSVNLSRKYGFVITLNTAGKINEIKYEVEITQLKATHADIHLFSVNRTSVIYVNGLEPDLLVEQLAYEAGKVFYPLIIETNLQGMFLRVSNHKDIKSRWAEKTQELQRYFEGEPAQKYIALMDSVIANNSQINKAIARDLLISTCFPGLYKSYSPLLKITDTMQFPVAGYAKPAQYTVAQEINAELNDYNAIEIHHHGNLTDDRSITDFEQGYDFALSKIEDPDLPSAKGKYDGLYVLEPDTNAIEMAVINITLELSQTKSFNLKLFNIKEEKVKPPPSGISKSQPQLLIIDGEYAGKDQQANIFSKFMDSLFGK